MPSSYYVAWDSQHHEEVLLQRRGYTADHQEEKRLYDMAYREKNGERIRKKKKSYYSDEENKKKKQSHDAAYRLEHLPEERAAKHRRRAILRGVPHERFTDEEIYVRDQGICQLCFKRVSKR